MFQLLVENWQLPLSSVTHGWRPFGWSINTVGKLSYYNVVGFFLFFTHVGVSTVSRVKKPLEAAVLLFQTNISLSTRRGNPKLSPFLPEKLVPVPFVTSHGSIPELSIAAIFLFIFFKSEQIVDDWWVNWQAGDSIAKKKKSTVVISTYEAALCLCLWQLKAALYNPATDIFGLQAGRIIFWGRRGKNKNMWRENAAVNVFNSDFNSSNMMPKETHSCLGCLKLCHVCFAEMIDEILCQLGTWILKKIPSVVSCGDIVSFWGEKH